MSRDRRVIEAMYSPWDEFPSRTRSAVTHIDGHTGTTTIDARSSNVGNAIDAYPAGSSQDNVPADRRSTHTFQRLADALLYLTI
jgi:hypothetical protein